MHEIVGCDLISEAQAVLQSLSGREMEVQNTSARWYRMKLMPYYTMQQQVGGVVITFLDITAFKEAEETSRKAERRYHFLISSLPDTSILVFDHEHRFLIAGGEELTKVGFEREKVEGFTLSEAFPPAVVELFTPFYERALKGEVISFEHNFGDFAYRQTILPIRNETGEIEAGMVMAHNISDRVKVEDALRKSLEKYQVLFDTFPYGITVADKNGQILEGNLEAERILGISKEALAQRDIDDVEWCIIRPDGSVMPSEEYASVRALKEKHRVDNVTMGIVRAKDETAWINVTAVPLGDDGVVVTYHEVKIEQNSPPKANRPKKGRA
jgi:PAS domain S-box-containing protein